MKKIPDDMYVIEKTSEGWWVYYKDGWKSSIDPHGSVHYDKESTKRDLLKLINRAVPCRCNDCLPKVIN